MSERSQVVVLWWGVAMAIAYSACLIFLFHMVPPPSPSLDAHEVATFYQEHTVSIRIGATIASWVSAFMLPILAVCAVQIRRQEKGRIWSALALVGGAMMSLFLVLPPIFWGVAAWTPTRPADVTLLMHELGMMTLVTTDQFYVFTWVAIAVMCFTSSPVRHSPFPRWFGWVTVWIAIMFEAGALAFLVRKGVFAWDGLFVFWAPLSLFGVWIIIQVRLLLRALTAQRLDREHGADVVVEAPRVPAEPASTTSSDSVVA
ncbi:hypothetical protein [Amycolatopsis acididurans]|uniref:hypothetical protein n=1 Tax=Amycolatopsis acididurans TaxID=2724524 RepID=UPI001B335530|nr:hypothetical protein [Amycolatopsis acididurans]